MEPVKDATVFITPKDIDLKNRKKIMRNELAKLFGKPINREEHIEHIRLKQEKFDKKKARRKLAIISKKRNW